MLVVRPQNNLNSHAGATCDDRATNSWEQANLSNPDFERAGARVQHDPHSGRQGLSETKDLGGTVEMAREPLPKN